ncbi:SCO family protein [Thermoflavimicrobium daqui]|uniref:Cytochrome c oxidase assembly protein n=1 Tax=Thermoflavimicrobium daqui TaxID=2137476 RepID=A0A364K8N6_9BACL|nr:SCO family protein [Thermoflavimicrobium daqui]RAL26661.1 cytochrome c oxidase assembly protein [Thermoflavimicrobium daqui]
MKRTWQLCVIILLMASLIVGCSTNQSGQASEQNNPSTHQQNTNVADLNWKVNDFNYKDQNGKPFGLKDLKGKIWLTDFVFTRCPNVCPPMTANMANVQKELKKAGLDIQFVSFSVDPEYDKPEVLKTFGEKHGVDFANWSFLTGYTFTDIQKMAMDTFKGSIDKAKSPSPDVVLFNHPTQFFLVDQTGKVIKFYDGLKPDMKQITQDVKQLQKK